jgi:hypothetical protein
VTEYVYGKTPVVEIGSDVLYAEDIKQVIPLGLSEADSTLFAERYIRNWAQDVLFYQNAIRNIPDTKDIDRLVENYRRSLFEHEYQRRLIDQKFSSDITEEEIEQFFDNNQRLFVLDESLIKGLFLKISNKSHDLADIRNLYTRMDDESFEEIEKLSLEEQKKHFRSFDDFCKEKGWQDERSPEEKVAKDKRIWLCNAITGNEKIHEIQQICSLINDK